jgi:hypothetical protein
MCISTTGTPSDAAACIAPSPCNARTSLIMPAPAAMAARITLAFEVSTEIGTCTRLASASITGMTRASSSASLTGAAPGRVDSPPTSIASAPSSTSRSACATGS